MEPSRPTISLLCYGEPPLGNLQDLSFSEVDLADYRFHSATLESIAALEETPVTVDGGLEPGSRPALKVTQDYFDVVQVTPRYGRLPHRNESEALVLSELEWDRQFGSRFEHGRRLVVDGRPLTVVGVWPSFGVLGTQPRLWLFFQGDEKPFRFRTARSLQALGRLAPGTRLEEARQELKGIAATLARRYPETNTDLGIRKLSLKDQLLGDAKLALQLLLGAIGLVLALACFTAGKILLSSMAAREQEWATRRMLGAGRMRLFGLLLGNRPRWRCPPQP